ncbi:MAG: RNA polymerase sigma factor [Candidatus Kerfeldbacteria bacterium]|nr:RNA polymerase sigma factor [Candidatus Kerfeldbacteria bacterium]
MLDEQFLEAYDAYADAIFRHCYFRVYDRERARDLAQETFTKTWEYLITGKKVENLRAFLYRVANNLVIDESRKRRPVSLDELQEQGFDPGERIDESLHARLDANAVLELLDRLSPDHRQVIVYRFVDQLGPKEIAALLDESENVISVRLNRAIKQLRMYASRPRQ